jgi:dTDP-4-dehydrorhamnose 3,5-epimerase
MEILPTEIPEVKRIVVKRHEDPRGFFAEIFIKKVFAEAGLPAEFVQDNQSFSRPRGTVRGLHYQIPPYAQDKLISVVRGAIVDVAVDIRKNSPTFGRHVRLALSADSSEQIFVPAGFAHGFCTLEADTEVIYKVSRYYSRDHERGILWNDPALKIDWPVAPSEAVVSEKDGRWPTFAKATDFF